MSVAVQEQDRIDAATSPEPRWPLLRPVLIFHLITRGLVITALVIASALSGRTLPEVVTRWDGLWYQRVAVEGYPSPLPLHPDGRVMSSTAAFFLIFPLLVKGLMATGIPFWLAGMIINLIASTGAVMIIVLVGRSYLDRRPAQLLGCLWAAFPVSAVLSTTYTEAVFTLFGAAALLFTARRNWILAGVAAALAGATRSPGIVYAGAVGLGALVAIIRDREWRSLAGAIIAPLGFVGSVLYIGLRTGTLDAWQLTERDGWHTSMSSGSSWWDFLTAPPATVQGRLHIAIAIFGIALLVLTLVAVVQRPPAPIIGLMLVGAFTAFAFGGVAMNAAPRVMMSFFPILAPLAILLDRLPPALRWILLGAGAALAAVIGGYYFAFAPLPP
ncbi:MAG: hypothetical protein J2P23_03185 [Microlunatus sp.]|nr:hypothetical protein [Microlunatus sp.]